MTPNEQYEPTYTYHKPKRLVKVGWRWWALVGSIALIAVLALVAQPSSLTSEPLNQAAPAPAFNVSGTWSGYLYVEGYENAYNYWELRLEQNGNTVVGTSFLESETVYDIQDGRVIGTRPIQTGNVTMSVRGTVDPVTQTITLTEFDVLQFNASPEVTGWCHKSGTFQITKDLITGINIPAETCGVVNVVLERQ